METHKLPKGTTLYFGTTSNHLNRYFKEGIPQHITREGIEPSSSEASEPQLFVGDVMAYFSACASFGASATKMHNENQIVLGRFVELVKFQLGSKPEIPGLAHAAQDLGLPVVLEFVLEEDTEVAADPHFVTDDNAEKSWKEWRSVILKRAGGIPSFWIQKVYFPRLIDFRDLGMGRHPRILEQTSDAALMVGALMQSWHKDTPHELLKAYSALHGRTQFSQSFAWTLNGIESFFQLNSMKDPATRILNQMTLWQDVDLLAKKQGIPLQ